jgi:hypothetical protein
MMRFPHLAFLGALSMTAAVAAACSSTTEVVTGSTTSGSGGGTGTGGATSSTTVSTTTTTTTTSSTGTGIGDPSTVYPAPHDPPPQVVSYNGPVLSAPRFVPVFFSNDDPTYKTQLTDFLSKVGGTQYWAANTLEYGVGAGNSTASVELAETATGTTDDNGIQTWLEGKLNGDDPAWPAADENTIYVLHYPAGFTITEQSQQGTSKSCVDFGGYHSNITLDAAHGNLNVAYAVIPRCGSFDGIIGVDSVTAAESHELLEASTDPYPMTLPAYASTDDAHFFWSLALGGGETGDMCAQQQNAFTKFGELAYTVQRTWSNNAAKAGHDPCVPALPGEVYFNAAPHLKDSISLNLGNQTAVFKGVKIPVGQSKTIDIDLFSDGDTGGPWDVDVQDASKLFGGPSTLDLSLDQTSGQNGQKLHLTINVTQSNQYGVEIFYVTSTLGQQQNLWFGIVGN